MGEEKMAILRRHLVEKMPVKTICDITGMDPWFIHQLDQIIGLEEEIRRAGGDLSDDLMRKAKAWGFSDRQLAHLTGVAETDIESRRKAAGIWPVYKDVDTRAAEF